MKKHIAFICAIIFLSMSFVGCQEVPNAESPPPTYEAFVYDYSDSLDGAISSCEYIMPTDTDSNESPPPDTYTVTFNGTTYTAKDPVSVRSSTTFRTHHLYYVNKYINFEISSDGSFFKFFDLGPLISESELGEVISADECKQIAEVLFSQYADPANYTVYISDLKEDKYYDVYFRKELPGKIITIEYCYIGIMADGRVFHFVTSMLHQIPDDLPTDNLNKDSAKAAMAARLDVLLADKKDEYFNMEYIYQGLMLTILPDGSYAFICDVTVACYNEAGARLPGYAFSFIVPVS